MAAAKPRTCQRVAGQTWSVCKAPASVRVRRNGTWKYFCAACFGFLSARWAPDPKQVQWLRAA